MRTNIDIDDGLMAAAMAAGAFKTKKEAVEAGLALLKRQADYARLLALKGKLRWGWDDEEAQVAGLQAREPTATLATPQPAKQTKASVTAGKSKGGARGRR